MSVTKSVLVSAALRKRGCATVAVDAVLAYRNTRTVRVDTVLGVAESLYVGGLQLSDAAIAYVKTTTASVGSIHGGWLTVTGVGPVVQTVNDTGLTASTYEAKYTISDVNAVNQLLITVTLTVA